jgi:hypothetical protein
MVVVSRRLLLWIAFAAVHAAVAWLGFHLPSQPMGDVYHVYEPWSARALAGDGVVGITEKWVYPQLALVPMMLAWVFGFLTYTPAWALFVTVCDALGFAFLVGRGRSRGRNAAAWFWLAAILLLGPVAIYRLDAVTVPLAIAGCLWLVRRPWLASVLLAVGTWIKIWPAALLAAAVFAVRRRAAVLGGAVAVSAATLLVVVIAGGGSYALGFLTEQTGRGLQLEAPVSALYLWQAMLGVPGSSIYYARDIITFEVTGPGVDAVIAAMTPLLVVAMVAIAALGAYKAWRGAPFAALFPPLGLAFVLAFIALNKVGSPQYMAWLVAPVVVGLVLQRRRWAGAAVVVLFVSWLTQLVYPVLYDPLLGAEAFPVLVLTLRNALVVALFVFSLVRLARVRTGAAAGIRSAAASSDELGAVGGRGRRR